MGLLRDNAVADQAPASVTFSAT